MAVCTGRRWGTRVGGGGGLPRTPRDDRHKLPTEAADSKILAGLDELHEKSCRHIVGSSPPPPP